MCNKLTGERAADLACGIATTSPQSITLNSSDRDLIVAALREYATAHRSPEAEARRKRMARYFRRQADAADAIGEAAG